MDIVEITHSDHDDCDVCGHWNLPATIITITHVGLPHTTRLCADCNRLIATISPPDES